MTRHLLPLIISIVVTACVPQNQFPSSGTGSTTGSTTGSVSANSCAELSGYPSLTACKQTTFAQCYPTTKIINNQTAVCYFPTTGWQQCTSNSAQWTYGAWGGWCRENTNTFKRTRSATCQRTVAACDCITDSATEERCSLSGQYTPCIPANIYGATACNASPTPTPSATPSWCSNAVLNYQVIDSSSVLLLKDVISNKYSDIRNYFSSRGYTIAHTRGSTTALAPSPLTQDLAANRYVIQVEGIKWGCFVGSNARIIFKIFKNGTLISVAEGSSGCNSSSQSSAATQQALTNLNAPQCQ